MVLAWNTRQLLSSEPGMATPVEFHFLSRRELYDSAIITADRHHSSAGEWVLRNSYPGYSLAVITRPTYAVPQELCLSFDCFSKFEIIGRGKSEGPPIDEVAIEFGTLLSLLVREPLLPLGARRVGGKPVKFDRPYGHVSRLPPANEIPAKGVNSIEFGIILSSLSKTPEQDVSAILNACRLYHAALSLSTYDISTAYFCLVSAIESLSGHYFKDQPFNFDDVQKFHNANTIIKQISSLINDTVIIDDLKIALLREEHFIWQKFRNFIEEFLPEEFWGPDELHPKGYLMPAIEKASLRRFLGEVYSARSTFTHTGLSFPAHVEIGISKWVSSDAVMKGLLLYDSTRFVPVFSWFERLTHLVLREYLLRVIASKQSDNFENIRASSTGGPSTP